MLLYDKTGNPEEYVIPCGKYLRFHGERQHRGGENKTGKFQFIIQILFAKRQEDLPPFDTVGLPEF